MAINKHIELGIGGILTTGVPPMHLKSVFTYQVYSYLFIYCHGSKSLFSYYMLYVDNIVLTCFSDSAIRDFITLCSSKVCHDKHRSFHYIKWLNVLRPACFSLST